MIIDWVEIEKLKINPNNPNFHSPEQIDRLVKLIKAYGWRKPIIVSNRTQQIVAGHGRYMAAKAMQAKTVPVHYQDFASDDEEYGFMVADNAITRWAELDFSEINKKLQDLSPDFDLQLLGLKDDFILEPADLKPKKEFKCPSCGYQGGDKNGNESP